MWDVERLQVGQALDRLQVTYFGVRYVEWAEIGQSADGHQVLHISIARKVEFLHIDNLMQLLGSRFWINFYLLGKHGFPINGQITPPGFQSFCVVYDQGEAIVFGEGTGLFIMNSWVVAIDFAQATVAFQRSQVADGGIAAIKLAQVFHFAQYLQVANRRTWDVEALQVFHVSERTEVTDRGVADVNVLELFEFLKDADVGNACAAQVDRSKVWTTLQIRNAAYLSVVDIEFL